MRLNRHPLLAVLSLVFFIVPVICLAIEMSGYFQPLKQALQSRNVSTGVLNFGEMGKILKHLGYVRLVENDEKRFPRTDREGSLAGEQLEVIPFQKKRLVDEYLYQANPSGNSEILQQFFPTGVRQKKNWPILAVQLPPDDLYGPEKGIITHRDRQGREWERKADVALIEDGELVFYSSAGLRVHGGKRRIIKPFQSYRLHFRKKYGTQAIPAGTLLARTGPLRTLVVQMTDWPPGQPINTPLAYDVSREMGCIVPETRLVEVYLNGASQGMAYVTEHLSRRQFDQYFDDRDYVFYKFRGQFSREDERIYHKRFWEYARDKEEFSLARVATSIDIDNFTRHVFSWVFNGTTDACQGVGVLDVADPKARLHWINWDMDHSYWDRQAETYHKVRQNWQQEGLELIYRDSNNYCDRSVLFTRLINESREYREYYYSLFSEILNHRLTQEFLLERVRHYSEMLTHYGAPHESYIAMLTDFMRNRAVLLRQEMVEQFRLEGPYRCRVQIPGGQSLMIDGHSYGKSYDGWYFGGQSIVVDTAAGNAGEKFSHWLVNGRKIAVPRLRHTVNDNTTIRAVFNSD